MRRFCLLMQLAFNNPCVAENWNPEPQPEVMLGVCAGDSRLGLRALRDWCQALDLQYVMPDCRVSCRQMLLEAGPSSTGHGSPCYGATRHHSTHCSSCQPALQQGCQELRRH